MLEPARVLWDVARGFQGGPGRLPGHFRGSLLGGETVCYAIVEKQVSNTSGNTLVELHSSLMGRWVGWGGGRGFRERLGGSGAPPGRLTGGNSSIKGSKDNCPTQ